MKQKRIDSAAVAIDLATQGIAGATELGAAGPKTITATVMTADKNAFVTSVNAYNKAVMQVGERQTNFDSVKATARSFATSARDWIKPHLGAKYSEKWNVAGFVGTLQVPHKVALLKLLLLKLAAYLAAVPTAQNTEGNLTAARAQALYNELVAAEDALILQRGTARARLDEKNQKFAALTKTLRSLPKELSTILDPNSGDWLKFGLNIPGLKETPETPANVVANAIAPGTITVEWDQAPRAQHYRVFVKVLGVDEEPVAVASPHDTDHTIEGLPPNATVEITVSAVNNGGESAASEVVSLDTWSADVLGVAALSVHKAL